MNRTFIVEDYAEDEFGHWAKDEVTGEQGCIDDERSCFWTREDTDCAWQSRPFKGRQVKRRKGKGKRKDRALSKGTGRAFFGDDQVQDPEWWSEDFAWWSKGKKGLSKGNDGFHKGGFSPLPSPQRCRQGLSQQQRQRKGSKKEKARNVLFLNPDCQPRKHPMKKGMAAPGKQTIGLPVTGLMIPRLQMLGGSAQRLTRHGWWQPQ